MNNMIAYLHKKQKNMGEERERERERERKKERKKERKDVKWQ